MANNNVYECMYILDANAYARNPGGASDTIQKMVDQIGGEVLASRLWNEQKLAFPIKGRYKGAYWLCYFRSDSSKLVEFNRACRLCDIVLRHLVIKIDDRLVDTLVATAKGEAVEAPPETASPEKETPASDESTEKEEKEAAAVDG
ncbi:MAG: 30S ribosomal protein S6 [Pirellulaceae bacterium]